jgi:hypothetical protein
VTVYGVMFQQVETVFDDLEAALYDLKRLVEDEGGEPPRTVIFSVYTMTEEKFASL